MNTNEAEVRAVLERYASAWARVEVEAIAACYHPDFTLHWFGHNALSGEHAGRAAAQRALLEFGRRVQRRAPSILAVMAGPERGAIVARETFGPEGSTVDVERVLVFAVEDSLLRRCWVLDQDQRQIDRLIGPPE